jgi:hypothetical protein
VTTSEWENRWIKVFTDAGMPYHEARDAFRVCYANRDINTATDAVKDAKMFASKNWLMQ